VFIAIFRYGRSDIMFSNLPIPLQLVENDVKTLVYIKIVLIDRYAIEKLLTRNSIIFMRKIKER